MHKVSESLGKIYLVAALLAGAALGVAQGAALPVPVFNELAAKCAPDVALDTLAALVKTESSFHPWAIAVVNGPSSYPTSLEQAQKLIADLSAQGQSFSVGLGQVNSQHFKQLGLSGPELLDPCLNLKVSAQILSACYRKASAELSAQAGLTEHGAPEQSAAPQLRAQALQGALSCYFSGNTTYGVKSGYVATVLANSTAAPHYVPSLQLLSAALSAEPAASLPKASPAPLIFVPSGISELWDSASVSSSFMLRDQTQPLSWDSR